MAFYVVCVKRVTTNYRYHLAAHNLTVVRNAVKSIGNDGAKEYK